MDPSQLQRLVDDDDIEGLLRAVSLDEIADAWWRYTLRARNPNVEPYDEPDWWAVEIWMNEGIYKSIDTARALIHAIAERAPEGADLGYLGAGPIEDMLVPDDETLRWVEEEAARSANFRTALADVWIAEFPAEAFLRVEAAAGTKLHRPSGAGSSPPRRAG